MSWLWLMLAIAGDAVGTGALARATERRRQRRRPSISLFGLAVAGFVVGMWAFAQALTVIPTALADAVFFAGATAVIAVVGDLGLGERLTARKIVALLLVVGVAVPRAGPGHG